MKIYTKSPYWLALIFSAVPYFFLNITGVILGRGLWTDSVIVFSSVFLGFIAGGTFAFKSRLLGLQQKIRGIVVDEKELSRWQGSLERNINKKTPFIIGLVIGILSIPTHYYFYGVYFTQKYSLVLYALNVLLLWVPSAVFITYVAWIIILEYFWLYGMNPKDRPLKLGSIPPKALQKFLETEDFARPEIKVRMGDINQFEPVVSLALFGSMLMGVGGALALFVSLKTESMVAGVLLTTGIVAVVIGSFLHPLKKINDVLKWEKAEKMDKINLILEEKVKTLERMIFDSSSKEKLRKHDMEEIESLTLYIDALRILESTHSSIRTMPVDSAMISKLLGSAMAPFISLILKTRILPFLISF